MKNRIAEARNAAGLSQVKLAELSGTTRRNIQEWEAQTYEPGAYKLYMVARALGCTMDELIVHDDDEQA